MVLMADPTILPLNAAVCGDDIRSRPHPLSSQQYMVLLAVFDHIPSRWSSVLGNGTFVDSPDHQLSDQLTIS